MAEPIENKATRSLKAVEELYHRLVLIVGKGGTGKTSVIQNLAKLLMWYDQAFTRIGGE